MQHKTSTRSKRDNAIVRQLHCRSRPLRYKDMLRQHLASDDALIKQITRAERRLRRTYPGLEAVWLGVDCRRERLVDGIDAFFGVEYYFTRGVGGAGYGTLKVPFTASGRGDAGDPMELTDAPDAVLALVHDEFDKFVAAVERTICGALFLELDARSDGGRAIPSTEQRP